MSVRSIVTFAVPFAFALACGDDPSDAAADAAAPDTTPLEDTTPVDDTTPIEDTSPVDDTAPAPDSAPVEDTSTPEVTPPTGLPILGAGSHSPAALTMDLILDDSYDLSAPRDLAFNPDAPAGQTQLFVADADMNMFIVTNPGTPDMRARGKSSLGSDHFMPAPVGLAFGDNKTFATAHECDWVTQPTTPADFMGPTLWPSNAAQFDGGWASHLDMLHNSPNSAGIAWDNGNAFWVFDGSHDSITLYDFKEDHGPGGEDHSDGVIVRWVEGEVKYVPGITSDMEKDQATGKLYVADTGNGRVAVLDTTSGNKGSRVGPNYDGADMYAWIKAHLTTLVDMSALGAPQPTGLALHDGKVFVSDSASAKVFAFELDDVNPGVAQTEPIDWMDLSSVVPAGSLGAITFDAEGRLYVIDVGGARVLRFAAPAAP